MAAMGTLFLVATPIGNRQDISQRALQVLAEVALVAAEDTRHTGRLLEHLGLTAPLISYHEHSEVDRIEEIMTALESDDVALVSDAGTPGLSDPGHHLVRAAWERGHRVSPIPGPSAPIAALVASGLPSDRFLYLGFLPRGRSERRKLLAERARDPWTLIAFEVPHRLRESLVDLGEAFGEGRPAALCRELTKLHEEILRGTIGELRVRSEEIDPRGEITLVVAGAEAEPRWGESTVRAAVQERVAGGDRPADIAKEIARLSGWKRGEIYKMTLEEQ